MRWLKQHEYDAITTRALTTVYGLDERQAKALVAARWPMPGSGVPSEALGRGLQVSLDDVADWLRKTVGECWHDGEPVDAAATFFSPSLVDSFLEWAVSTGRAKPTPVGEAMTRDFRPVNRILRAAKAGEN